MKLRLVLSIVIPFLRSAAELLRAKDEDSVGADDEAAKVIDAALEALAKYLAS